MGQDDDQYDTKGRAEPCRLCPARALASMLVTQIRTIAGNSTARVGFCGRSQRRRRSPPSAAKDRRNRTEPSSKRPFSKPPQSIAMITASRRTHVCPRDIACPDRPGHGATDGTADRAGRKHHGQHEERKDQSATPASASPPNWPIYQPSVTSISRLDQTGRRVGQRRAASGLGRGLTIQDPITWRHDIPQANCSRSRDATSIAARTPLHRVGPSARACQDFHRSRHRSPNTMDFRRCRTFPCPST